MESLKGLVQWLVENYDKMFLILAAVIGLAEAVTRLTKTEKDDGFVQRLGSGLKKVMDMLKIPNRLKPPKSEK